MPDSRKERLESTFHTTPTNLAKRSNFRATASKLLNQTKNMALGLLGLREYKSVFHDLVPFHRAFGFHRQQKGDYFA